MVTQVAIAEPIPIVSIIPVLIKSVKGDSTMTTAIMIKTVTQIFVDVINVQTEPIMTLVVMIGTATITGV